LSAGADYKTSDSNVLFSSVPVFDTRTDIFQLVAAYNGSASDRYGRSAFTATLAHSPGDVNDKNSDSAFNTSRALAEANYTYLNLSANRLTYLPASWTWALAARMQLANSNLLGSEQLSAAGTYAVRGFEEGLLYGDQGFVLRNEAGPPAFVLGDRIRAELFGFVDAARVRSVDLVPGENRSNEIAGAGIGVRASLSEQVSARLELGTRLRSTVPGVGDGGWRAHLGVSVTF
jgi:hemolysin activation/secretion protein